MYSACPECDERLNPSARQCACGWKNPALFRGSEKAFFDADHWRCAWVNGSRRCRYPGSVSHGLKGDAKYYCPFHFGGPDASEAARITDESYRWDGKPDSYLAMRIAAQKAPNAGGNGREKPQGAGVSGQLRNDAGRNAAVPIVHAAMAGMAGEMEPGNVYQEEF